MTHMGPDFTEDLEKMVMNVAELINIRIPFKRLTWYTTLPQDSVLSYVE